MGLVAGVVGIGLQVASMGAQAKANAIAAQGVVEQAQADWRNYTYQAQVAKNNAIYAKQQQELASRAGEESAYAMGLKTRAEGGTIKASQAASGIDVNSGSAKDAQEAAEHLGVLNALAIKDNAAREVYGYKVNESNFAASSGLYTAAAAESLRAGAINAAAVRAGGQATMLGSAASIAQSAYNLSQSYNRAAGGGF